MIVEVYLTIFFIFALIAGGIVALLGRPFVRRWNAETRLEEVQRQCALEEKAQREAAQKEVDAFLADDVTPPVSETLPTRPEQDKPGETANPPQTEASVQEVGLHTQEKKTQ